MRIMYESQSNYADGQKPDTESTRCMIPSTSSSKKVKLTYSA